MIGDRTGHLRWRYDVRDERASHKGLDPELDRATGEPQILCTFQLDTRSLYRFVSGTRHASGAQTGLTIGCSLDPDG